MSDPVMPTAFDWLFRILAGIGTAGGAVFTYVWHLNSKRAEDFEERLSRAEGIGQENRLENLRTREAMGQLQIKITENVSASIERVHDKIEQGNREVNVKFDQLNESVGDKIVELRRDLKSDIRDAVNSRRG